MRTKLKLSLLDDYLALSKILIFCNNFPAAQNEILSLKLGCENMLSLINYVFEKGKKDFSFAVFKQQVLQCVNGATNLHIQQSLIEGNLFDKFNGIKQNVLEKINKLS